MQKLNQLQLRDAILNEFSGMSLADNAAAIGIPKHRLSYWKTRPEWHEWESVLRQELSRVAVEAMQIAQ